MYNIDFYETIDGFSDVKEFLDSLRTKASTVELRPGGNRVFFFYFDHGTYVLLHHFQKKSQKTPRREILKAKSEMKDYISREERKL